MVNVRHLLQCCIPISEAAAALMILQLSSPPDCNFLLFIYLFIYYVVYTHVALIYCARINVKKC